MLRQHWSGSGAPVSLWHWPWRSLGSSWRSFPLLLPASPGDRRWYWCLPWLLFVDLGYFHIDVFWGWKDVLSFHTVQVPAALVAPPFPTWDALSENSHSSLFPWLSLRTTAWPARLPARKTHTPLDDAVWLQGQCALKLGLPMNCLSIGHRWGFRHVCPRVMRSFKKIPSRAAQDTPWSSASGEDVAGKPGWVWVVQITTAPATMARWLSVDLRVPRHPAQSLPL